MAQTQVDLGRTRRIETGAQRRQARDDRVRRIRFHGVENAAHRKGPGHRDVAVFNHIGIDHDTGAIEFMTCQVFRNPRRHIALTLG